MPILFTPRLEQVAALCYRQTEDGKYVLLVTSRDTGRWIVPKGWPIEGMDDAGSALQEAWEEAGVKKANVDAEPIGTFDYDKGLEDGESLAVRAQVFAAEVKELRDDYPEADERDRSWFAPDEAADLVDEPQLQTLLRNF